MGVRRYLLSLPERIVRSAAGLSGGLLRQAGHVVIPARLRKTRLYDHLVESALRFLIEQVGEVEGVYPAEGALPADFAIRRTAGNGLEMVGLLAFRASPVWVLAALADLTGAGRHLVREIAAELVRQQLLEPGGEFETVDQILDGLERTSARLADSINTPPLDVAGLRAEIAALRREAGAVPAPAIGTLERLWESLDEEARAQQRSIFELSAVMALNTVRRLPEHAWWLSRTATHAARHTGKVIGAAIGADLLGHYAATLEEIHRTGLIEYWSREFRPYLRAAARQFDPAKEGLIDKIL